MTIERPTPDYELTEDGVIWVARHAETGVASHGQTPTEAVEMAEEAARLHQQDHTPGDEEFQQMMLDKFDIDIDTSCW
jgi:predicted RNase H-like HicB family nuclease